MSARIWNYAKALSLTTLVMVIGLVIPQVNASSGPPSSVFATWPDATPVPKVEVFANREADGRWRITLSAAGFVFSDICTAVTEPTAIGHAHLYKGDTKIGAAYAPITTIGPFEPGNHRITIMLRAQDHRTLIGPDGILKTEIVLQEPSRPTMTTAMLAQ